MGTTGKSSGKGKGGGNGKISTTPISPTKEKEPEKITGFDFTQLSSGEQKQKIKELQEAMGQSGLEAGDPDASPNGKLYVNTGKSMCINAYLNSDGKDWHSSYTDWGGLINKQWIQNAIQKLDNGMKPLSESVQGYKYVSPEAFGKMIGIPMSESDANKLISNIESGATAKNTLLDVFKNTNYVNKGYTSMTYVPEHGSYDGQPVRLNIVMTKGKDAIVTSNHKEHEILGGRGQKYDFKDARVETVYSKAKGKYIKQLVVDVVI